MCVYAAYAVKLQCGREYGATARATQLDKLTEDELSGLPTNNLSTKRDFYKFSHLSEVTTFRNYRFQAKDIRNDMTLYKSKTGLDQSITKQIKKCLTSLRDQMECPTKDDNESQDTSKVWKGVQSEGLLQKTIGELSKLARFSCVSRWTANHPLCYVWQLGSYYESRNCILSSDPETWYYRKATIV